MTYRVHIQPSAEAELEDAYRWIAEDSPLAAARWYKGLVEAVGTLRSFPERCPPAPEDGAFRRPFDSFFFMVAADIAIGSCAPFKPIR